MRPSGLEVRYRDERSQLKNGLHLCSAPVYRAQDRGRPVRRPPQRRVGARRARREKIHHSYRAASGSPGSDHGHRPLRRSSAPFAEAIDPLLNHDLKLRLAEASKESWTSQALIFDCDGTGRHHAAALAGLAGDPERRFHFPRTFLFERRGREPPRDAQGRTTPGAEPHRGARWKRKDLLDIEQVEMIHWSNRPGPRATAHGGRFRRHPPRHRVVLNISISRAIPGRDQRGRHPAKPAPDTSSRPRGARRRAPLLPWL